MPYEPARSIRFCLLAAVAMVAHPSMAGGVEESWLGIHEQNFFSAFGVNAVVDGKPSRRAQDLNRLLGVAKSADEPLKTSARSFLAAIQKMRVTRKDVGDLQDLQSVALRDLGIGIGIEVFWSLMGRRQHPWDVACDLTDAMRDSFVAAWDLQTGWILRALEAQAEADDALGEVTAGLERRVPRIASPAGCSLGVAFDPAQGRLRVDGKAGEGPLVQPVVQVTLHRTSVSGRWAGMNVASVYLVRLMGVEGMDFDAAVRAGVMGRAQEMVRERPLLAIQAIPDVKAGGDFALNLECQAGEVWTLGRVDAKVWCGGGWFEVERLAGLEEAKRSAAEYAEKEYRKRLDYARRKARELERKIQAEIGRRQLDAFIARGMAAAQRQNSMNQRQFSEISRLILGGAQ